MAGNAHSGHATAERGHLGPEPVDHRSGPIHRCLRHEYEYFTVTVEEVAIESSTDLFHGGGDLDGIPAPIKGQPSDGQRALEPSGPGQLPFDLGQAHRGQDVVIDQLGPEQSTGEDGQDDGHGQQARPCGRRGTERSGKHSGDE